MDREQRAALIDEGLDPDNLAVAEAIDVIQWELSMLRALLENPEAADL